MDGTAYPYQFDFSSRIEYSNWLGQTSQTYGPIILFCGSSIDASEWNHDRLMGGFDNLPIIDSTWPHVGSPDLHKFHDSPETYRVVIVGGWHGRIHLGIFHLRAYDRVTTEVSSPYRYLNNSRFA